MILALLLAAVLASAGKDGLTLSVESETATIDPAKSVFLTVRLESQHGLTAELPDIRNRARGFSLAEDYLEEPTTLENGSTIQVATWRLVPEACAEEYAIRPFAVSAHDVSFVVPAIHFEQPPAREPVTGEMECEPKKDFPPLSWKLVGLIALGLVGLIAVLAALYFAVRFLVRKVKEHRMSPIERAWVELDRLIKKGLPGRGKYKDFYVELTMVVRRYIQRKYGTRAPNLTTEEFFGGLADLGALGSPGCLEELKKFLESADLVKFAGVEATPEMADSATSSARSYLKTDSQPS